MQCHNVTLSHSGRFVRTGSRFLSSWMSLISKAFAPDSIFGMDAENTYPETADGLTLAVPFVALPLCSGLIAMYRVSRIADIQGRPPLVYGTAVGSATQAPTDQRNDVALAVRPRIVHLTIRGYFYVGGVALAAGLVLWLLSLVLRGIAGPLNPAIAAKYALALLIWSWAFWPCVSFFRNRIRERRLFIDGELSQGFVLTQSKTSYGRLIVYLPGCERWGFSKSGDGFLQQTL